MAVNKEEEKKEEIRVKKQELKYMPFILHNTINLVIHFLD